MLNFLGLMGYSMPDGREVFSLDEFVEDFSFDRVSLGGPVFDMDKLIWLNGSYIRMLDDEQLLDMLYAEVFTKERLGPIVPLLKERMRTLGDFMDGASFYFTHQVDLPIQEVMRATKQRDPKETANYLKKFVKSLDELQEFNDESLESHMRNFCEQMNLKTREFFMVARLAITGKRASPPLIQSMTILGRAACAQRLRAAIDKLNAYRPQKG